MLWKNILEVSNTLKIALMNIMIGKKVAVSNSCRYPFINCCAVHLFQGVVFTRLPKVWRLIATNVLRIRDVALIRMLKSRYKAKCAISFIRCYVLGGLSVLNLIGKQNERPICNHRP